MRLWCGSGTAAAQQPSSRVGPRQRTRSTSHTRPSSPHPKWQKLLPTDTQHSSRSGSRASRWRVGMARTLAATYESISSTKPTSTQTLGVRRRCRPRASPDDPSPFRSARITWPHRYFRGVRPYAPPRCRAPGSSRRGGFSLVDPGASGPNERSTVSGRKVPDGVNRVIPTK